jgi:hypothetical protein
LGESRNTGDAEDDDAQGDPYEIGHSDDDEPGKLLRVALKV